MPLVPGTRLGPYEIVSPLGAGGMGEVYRARDPRLGREVAIKVLPDALAHDPERLARFEREARAVAALNHPNIVVLHSVEEADGVPFLTMELVEGQTLADHLAHGGFPIGRALDLAIALAEALEAAHGRGVIHRDLKPGNVMITGEGRLKVLDFGLAKLAAPDWDPSLSLAPTVAGPISTAGEVVGTVPYMAPEQIRGEPADARTDLFAFGTTLYEMVSGKRPFTGSTMADVGSAILRDPPAPLPGYVPQGLRDLILCCLAKEREQRPVGARDVRVALENIRASGGSSSAARAAGARPLVSGRMLAALFAGAAVVAVLAWVAGDPGHRLRPQKGPPRIQSLAVLPLKDLAGDTAHGYFAEGMTEALITELSKIGALRVISRTSVMKYRDSEKTVPQVSRELGVDAVIEGSVLREGDQVRINVQLIHGPSDAHLWARSFDRKLTGILLLYSEVAQAIAGQIRVTVTPQEQSRLTAARTVNPRAYELYVLGRHLLSQRTIENYRRASERCREALALDPGYAPAHTALAEAYMLLGEQGGLRQQEARSLAAAQIDTAMKLDPNLAEAHTSLAMLKLHFEWDWPEAEKAHRRALELNPGFAAGHQHYGRDLAFVGRLDEALAQLVKAKELDPLSTPINAFLAQVHLFARRHDAAEEQLRRTLELDPNHPLARHNLGEVYLAQGRWADAIRELEKSIEVSGRQSTSHYLAMLGCAYARGGRPAQAKEILDELLERQERDLVSAFDMASLYASMGKAERALAELEEGYERRDAWLIELEAWPWFDAQRDDPRFQDLLRRIGFPGWTAAA